MRKATSIASFRFLPCPICKTQTDTKVLNETILIRYPLFCAKCRQETLVDVVKMKMVLSDNEEIPVSDKIDSCNNCPAPEDHPILLS